MRIEKIEKWTNRKETTHVYSWREDPHPLEYVVEVHKNGCVMVRDLEGHCIHVAHILELIDSAKVVEHQMERERMQKVRDGIRAEKLSGIRNEILAEIST